MFVSADFNRRGTRLLYGLSTQPLVVFFDVPSDHQKSKWMAPLEKSVSLHKGFLFLASDLTRCVSLDEAMNWSSLYRRTTASTSGHCRTAKDVTRPSTISRPSPCADSLNTPVYNVRYDHNNDILASAGYEKIIKQSSPIAQ